MSQTDLIFQELKKGRKLSFFDIVGLGITNHTGRIADLRKKLLRLGNEYIIVTTMQEKNVKEFAEYTLEKVGQLNLV